MAANHTVAVTYSACWPALQPAHSDATDAQYPMTRRWLPFLLWTALLLFASGGHFSSRNTGGLLARLAALVSLEPSPEVLSTLNFIIRKTGHLIAYGIEGALAFRAFGRVRWRIAGALALTLLVATLDELQQSANPTRTGSALDVAIDGIGASVAIAISARWRRKRSSAE